MSDKGFHAYRRYLQGEAEGLNQLVQIYSDALIRYIYGYVRDSSTAEDIMEDTIVALIMKRIHPTSGDKLHGYLYKVARNKSIDYLRKQRKVVALEDVQNVLTAADVEREHSWRARNEALYVCMQKLPQQYREVLHLAYFEGFSLPEIAGILHKSPKQIYNLHARAKSTLRELLIKEGIDHEDI